MECKSQDFKIGIHNQSGRSYKFGRFFFEFQFNFGKNKDFFSSAENFIFRKAGARKAM